MIFLRAVDGLQHAAVQLVPAPGTGTMTLMSACGHSFRVAHGHEVWPTCAACDRRERALAGGGDDGSVRSNFNLFALAPGAP